MESKKLAEQYAKILSGRGYRIEKRELLVRAIQEDQKKFLRACRERWGDDFYYDIVPLC